MTGRRDPARDMEAARAIARRAASLGARHTMWAASSGTGCWAGRTPTWTSRSTASPPGSWRRYWTVWGAAWRWGASFGIYGLKGYGLDIAMPRRERATGRGHRDFQVSVDPFLGTEQAARRRDFTVNALMENVLTGQVLDHFHGLDDLRRGILRHVDSRTFPEDPLRVLRGAQFAARFRFAVAPETVALCRGHRPVRPAAGAGGGELCKALLQADRPSLFFETLRDMGQLSPWFPEVEALIGVPQDPGFHQEGDVWNHTMLVLDQAAALRSRARRPFAFMLAALTHDLGKTVTTQRVRGRIHAYAHETAGVPLVEALLRRIVGEKAVTAYVLNMVELHMKPNALVGADASVKASNRMFDRSVEPEDLILLAAADGRAPGAAGPGRIRSRGCGSGWPCIGRSWPGPRSPGRS